jgi:hypothetical protein
MDEWICQAEEPRAGSAAGPGADVAAVVAFTILVLIVGVLPNLYFSLVVLHSI